MIDPSHCPYRERHIFKTDLIKVYLYESLSSANPFQSISSLRKTTKKARGFEASVLLIRTVMKSFWLPQRKSTRVCESIAWWTTNYHFRIETPTRATRATGFRLSRWDAILESWPTRVWILKGRQTAVRVEDIREGESSIPQAALHLHDRLHIAKRTSSFITSPCSWALHGFTYRASVCVCGIGEALSAARACSRWRRWWRGIWRVV